MFGKIGFCALVTCALGAGCAAPVEDASPADSDSAVDEQGIAACRTTTHWTLGKGTFRCAKWSAAFAEPTSPSGPQLTGARVDAAGNVILVGAAPVDTDMQNGKFNEALVAKYDTTGKLLWSVTAGVQPGSAETPLASAIDAKGDVYVAGFYMAFSPSLSRGSFVIKVGSDGKVLWTAREPDASIAAVAAGADGVFVTGTYTAAYGANGETRWIKRHGDGEDGKAVATDPNGRVYVAGTKPNGAWIARLEPSTGTASWDQTHANAFEVAALATDEDGVYAVGRAPRPNAMEQAFAARLDPRGKMAWKRTFATRRFERDIGEAVAVDPTGGVFVLTAGDDAEPGDAKRTLHKLCAQGKERWQATVGGFSPGFGGPMGAAALVVTPGGQAVYSVENQTRRYDAKGKLVGELRGEQALSSVGVDAASSVFVVSNPTTVTPDMQGHRDVFVAKF